MLGFHPLGYHAISETEAAPATGAAIAATINISTGVAMAHGVSVAMVARVPVVASVDAEHTTLDVDVDIAAVVPVAASVSVAHGAVVGVSAGVPVAASASADHGVAGIVVGHVAVSASLAALHLRYEVRGEVRLGGVLVNRRVRCSKRTTGELMGQADTVAGVYRVHAGFDEAEVYVTAIDMADAATDWVPPTANRLVPVLASDTA